MTNRRPYMPLYIADYEADTRHLTAEEDGVYSRLLRAMWSAGGELPDDDIRLAQIARISLKRWNGMAATIRAFFLPVDGHIEQKRLNRELQRLNRVSAARSAAGKQGGRPSEKEGDVALREGSEKTEKPLKNGQDENQMLSNPRARSRASPARDLRLQTSDLFEDPKEGSSHSAPPKDRKMRQVWNALSTVLSPPAVRAVIDHRTTIKHPLSPRAAELLAGDFAEAKAIVGLTPDQAADAMIAKGWRGFKAEWLLRDHATARSPPAAYGAQAPVEDDYSEENMLRIAAKLEAKYGRKT